jgi:hypothetical protein
MTPLTDGWPRRSLPYQIVLICGQKSAKGSGRPLCRRQKSASCCHCCRFSSAAGRVGARRQQRSGDRGWGAMAGGLADCGVACDDRRLGSGQVADLVPMSDGCRPWT